MNGINNTNNEDIITEQRDNGSLIADNSIKKKWTSPFLHSHSIRDYLKSKGHQCSRTYLEFLGEHVKALIETSMKRAKENGRSRLQKQDI